MSMKLFLISLSLVCSTSWGSGLTCYSCVQGIDKGCEDPFKPESINLKPVNCDTTALKPFTYPNEHRPSFNYSGMSAKGCRKILQEIDDVIHIVRQCAYTGDNVNGLKRTGNKGVRLYYYQCDGAKCNVAANSHQSVFLVLVFCSILSSIFTITRLS